MSIEIIVGLPHLGDGPILARAKAIGQPALISANALSRWTDRRGWREWCGWRIHQLGNAQGLPALCLDSAGFVAAARYGGFPWTLADYVELAAAHPFRWWASADYCVEAEIARDREEVFDRISRTIRANRDCRRLAEDHGIADTLMPVIQGRLPEDYERCLDALWRSLKPGALIGVGSMCRRHVHGPEGLIAVIDHLDQVLPAGVRLHVFGAKGAALPFLLPFAHRVASIDSQAYGIRARQSARKAGVAKTDSFVAQHLEQWIAAQQDRLSQPPRRLPSIARGQGSDVPGDPWEAAIAQARSEIRALIESGDLDHNELTLPWIEQWAADIYRDRVAA
ncbi:DUF7221 family queuine tRNA-ribosyltransferase-like protein [Sphingobium chlorophenolicum]|uniref:DeoxyPurine in DNA protein A domain-containing protein n=1 Tax=Sphingobium chlorophenolicum TaxID=46429 RepID=A0A081REY9_SPHCR|nr:hypothetical protein [Sphingobium chlorophenolicum]KEQ53762.1 hypothetical protein BV95_01978 [Sphingobium chlorophenolicum]